MKGSTVPNTLTESFPKNKGLNPAKKIAFLTVYYEFKDNYFCKYFHFNTPCYLQNVQKPESTLLFQDFNKTLGQCPFLLKNINLERNNIHIARNIS